MKPIVIKNKAEIIITRDKFGVPVVAAASEEDLYFGQGYIQANDRGMQILLMRVIGTGRISEMMDSSDEMLEVDIFFRKMNFNGDTSEVRDSLDERTGLLAQSFCNGMNLRFDRGLPFELILSGYKHQPWKIEDTVLMGRMIGYLGLQQTQADAERFLVELVQAGIGKKMLEELFQTSFSGMDFNLIRKVKMKEKTVPDAVRWNAAIPTFSASNAWVVSPKKTESRAAILAGDTHMEGNRLPNIWQEVMLKINDRYMAGFSIPGVPGVLSGRNNDLAWSPTYSFMDSVDSWIEDCREGKCRRINHNKTEWVRFHERKEFIKRKRKPQHRVTFFENEHGVLNGDPFMPGYYLATRWSAGKKSGAKGLQSTLNLFSAATVLEAQKIFSEFEFSFNWLLSDRKGNIGYQMSGLMPDRPPHVSGLYPVCGWESANDWKGFVGGEDLPKRYNPREGYIVNANNGMNRYGKRFPTNLYLSTHRAKRAEEFLKNNSHVNLRQMAEIQYDTYSQQAADFMDVLLPVLPDTPEGNLLKTWNCRYELISQGAQLFEEFYRHLYLEAFGGVFGQDVMEHLFKKSSLFVYFFGMFDAILLKPFSPWFGSRTREEIYLTAFQKAVDGGITVKTRERIRVDLKNILTGKSPFFFFSNRKSIYIPGGRGSLFQLQSYNDSFRNLRLLPVNHMLVDFGIEGVFTNILGGPSDRPFSPFYDSDVQNWLKGRYRHKKPDLTG